MSHLDVPPTRVLFCDDFSNAIRNRLHVRQQLALVDVLVLHRDFTHFEGRLS